MYSLVRPFHSQVARWFLMIGSILGILSILGVSYTQIVADFLGIGRGADLYLYLGLVTIFLFVTFTLNRFDALNKKISHLVKEVAILNKNQNNINKKKYSNITNLLPPRSLLLRPCTSNRIKTQSILQIQYLISEINTFFVRILT